MFTCETIMTVKIMNIILWFLMHQCKLFLLLPLPCHSQVPASLLSVTIVCIFCNSVEIESYSTYSVRSGFLIFYQREIVCIHGFFSFFFKLLINTPLYGKTIICFSVHVLVGIWVVAITTKLLWTFMYKSLCRSRLSFVLYKCLSKLIGSYDSRCFLRIWQTIFQNGCTFCIFTSSIRFLVPSHPC